MKNLILIVILTAFCFPVNLIAVDSSADWEDEVFLELGVDLSKLHNLLSEEFGSNFEFKEDYLWLLENAQTIQEFELVIDTLNALLILCEDVKRYKDIQISNMKIEMFGEYIEVTEALIMFYKSAHRENLKDYREVWSLYDWELLKGSDLRIPPNPESFMSY